MWPDTHRCTPPSRTSAFRSVRRDCFPRGLAFSQVPRPISPRGRVYPRECGAATVPPQQRMQWGGLSPRVRGSRSSGGRRRHPTGSIPASTGQPLNDAEYSGVDRVYPREYGAAGKPIGKVPSMKGLSPRVRGSPCEVSELPDLSRSIPASTGQPRMAICASVVAMVYPREYGAALRRRRCRCDCRGLSPRVRGSRHVLRPRIGGVGSIPASTGQPLSAYQL